MIIAKNDAGAFNEKTNLALARNNEVKSNYKFYVEFYNTHGIHAINYYNSFQEIYAFFANKTQYMIGNYIINYNNLADISPDLDENFGRVIRAEFNDGTSYNLYPHDFEMALVQVKLLKNKIKPQI
jgi:hypothetical protein